MPHQPETPTATTVRETFSAQNKTSDERREFLARNRSPPEKHVGLLTDEEAAMTPQLTPDNSPLDALRWAAHACADPRLSLTDAAVAAALAAHVAEPTSPTTRATAVPTPVRTDHDATIALNWVTAINRTRVFRKGRERAQFSAAVQIASAQDKEATGVNTLADWLHRETGMSQNIALVMLRKLSNAGFIREVGDRFELIFPEVQP